MFKTITKSVLPFVMMLCLVLSLSACSGTSGRTDTSNTPQTSQNTETGQSSFKNEADNSNIVSSSPRSNAVLGEFDKTATISETVLVDENDIIIKATSLTFSNYDVELALVIENNSTKNLSFICESMGYSRNSVNGYMIEDGYLNCDVAAGKKANDSINFSYDNLMICGIMSIADIEIGFDIKDTKYNQVLLTGPIQIKTSLADTYDYNTDYYKAAIVSDELMNKFNYSILFFAEDELYNQKGISIVSECVIVNKDDEPTLMLEVYNNSDKFVYLAIDDIAINGLVVNSSTWSSEAINPKKYCIVIIQLSSVLDANYWEAYGIKEVGVVSLSLEQKDDEYNSIGSKAQISVSIPNADSSFDQSGDELYNANGFCIVSKTLLADDSDYSNDMYVLLYAENTSGKTVSFDDVYNSLSVNGYMTDFWLSSVEIPNGGFGMIVVKLYELSLEKNGISSIEDISEIELGLSIEEGYDTIDEPTLTISY